MNLDELRQQMEEDDLADQAEIGKLSVREYAKLKGMAPQLVYYYIRNGHIKQETCVCGRKVIDVAGADAFFLEKAEEKRPREGLPTTSTD